MVFSRAHKRRRGVSRVILQIMATPKTWAKIQPVENPLNLSDITTEQLDVKMQDMKLNEYLNEDNRNIIQADEQKDEVSDADNDEVIANILQHQFNEEHDMMLKRMEEKVNRDSKVGISYTNYRTSSYDIKDEDNVDSDNSNRDFDRFVSIEKEQASIPRCGYKKVEGGSQIVTKHDMLRSSRLNACRVLQFPPGISTGDTGGFDVKLDNKVFNILRAHSQAQRKKGKSSPKPKTHTK
ncbi:serine/threonine-protein kinase RIO3-like [Odontomachus brunneus]|uniref:serine/threonine-protein kinase RIO3-like n=1 Tax=Odontomachus brunneus TaxID=486640 RepID=UPI0013F289A1|nr:serine/threonine-protein kinase RIO3-like [Odontomachus brunneus]XP_032676685.1 serine/threonine-protein kinase RIO3-like [Odontomachus brunneus]